MFLPMYRDQHDNIKDFLDSLAAASHLTLRGRFSTISFMKHCWFLFLPVLAMLSSSCLLEHRDCICTTEFRLYTVHIFNNNHQPIDSLVTRVTDKKSQVVYRTDSSHSRGFSFSPDEYVVLTDGEKRYFRSIPDTVIFHASNGNHNISEPFAFYVDDCQCHLLKFSGPDSIVVR